MKCVARAVLQVHHVAADEARAVVGDRLDRRARASPRDDEKPGTIGAIRTPALTPASTSSRTARSRCSGCAVPGSSVPPRVFVDGRHAHVDRACARRARAPSSTSLSRTTIGPFVMRPNGVRPRASASIDRARQLVVPFDRLIRIGRGAERDLLARPRRPIELAREHLDEVLLHEDDRRELVVRRSSRTAT